MHSGLPPCLIEHRCDSGCVDRLPYSLNRVSSLHRSEDGITVSIDWLRRGWLNGEATDVEDTQ